MTPDDGSGTVRWRDLVADAVSTLGRAGIPSADSDARRIVAESAGCTDAELVMALDELVTERAISRFDDMVRRRVDGEPLQYVLGSWGFRSLDLMVDRRVLIPRPETESVVEVALRELDRLELGERTALVADLGTGSGAIALSIAVERVRTQVWATDVSADALAVASANIAGIGRPGARVRTAQGAWFAALPSDLRGSFDLVVSNPPYVPVSATLPSEVEEWEPVTALRSGADGLDDLKVLVRDAGDWLRPHGSLVCELSPEQAEAMLAFAAERFGHVGIERDLSGRDRTLVARGPTG